MYKWGDGSKFDEEWNNGLMHGVGEYIWEYGKSYESGKMRKQTARGAAKSKLLI